MDIITVSAKTLDEAITKALLELQTTSEHLHYEIVQKESSGFLGLFGSKPCVLRARVMSEEEERNLKKQAQAAARQAHKPEGGQQVQAGKSDRTKGQDSRSAEKRQPEKKQAQKQGEKVSEGVKSGAGEPGDKGGRGERVDRPERNDRAECGDWTEKGDHVERGDRAEKGDRTERGDRTEKGDRIERGDRAERGDRVERGDRGERGDRTEQASQTERSDRSGRGDRMERGSRGGRGDRYDRSGRGDFPDQADRRRGHEAGEGKPAEKKERRELHVDEEQVKKAAAEFLGQVFGAMGMEVSVESRFDAAEGELQVMLAGADMGILIGKRGQTLDSLQYLVSLVVNKDTEGYLRVKLDTENYRERRRETLETLARNISYKVKRTRRPVSLEPMNPYERRIIHSALQNDRFVVTRSEGEDPYRHVVISLRRESYGDNRRGRYNGNNSRRERNYDRGYDRNGGRGNDHRNSSDHGAERTAEKAGVSVGEDAE